MKSSRSIHNLMTHRVVVATCVLQFTRIVGQQHCIHLHSCLLLSSTGSEASSDSKTSLSLSGRAVTPEWKRSCTPFSTEFYIGSQRTRQQLMALLFLIIGAHLVLSRPVGTSNPSSSGKTSTSDISANIESGKKPLAQLILDKGLVEFESLLDLLSVGQDKAVAIGATDGRAPMTYATLRKSVKEVDLAQFGIAPKSVVATLMPAGDHAAALLLVLLARYVTVPLNASVTMEELMRAIKLFEVKAIITVPNIYQKMADHMPDNICIIEASADPNLAGVFCFQSPRGSLQPLSLEHTEIHQLNGPGNNVLLLGTSGTTSAPKVVPITLKRLSLGALVWAEAFGITHSDCALNMMPLYHVGGIITNVLALVLSGASVVCAPKLNEEQFASWIQEFHITYYSAVPTMHQQVMKLLGESDEDTVASVRAQLRIIATGAAHLPHASCVKLTDITGAPVLPTYGMTECMPIAIVPLESYPCMEKPDSVGRPVCDVSLILESGSAVSSFCEQGEVCVRGPLVMEEYLSGGKASLHLSADGGAPWFRTGDLGTLDEDGFLKLVGRAKEVINRGGELISPFEVESMASKIGAGYQCVAFSAPHEQLGETVALGLVHDPQVQFDGKSFESMQQHLSQRLAPVKVPEIFVFMDELPKGATGKVTRIGFADRLGLATLSVSTPSSERVLQAQRQNIDGKEVWSWQPFDFGDRETTMPSATDSLGMPSRGNALDQQVTKVFLCLYAIASINIITLHACLHGNLKSLLNAAPASLLALITRSDWSMNIFFAGMAFTDQMSNEGAMPNFGPRDIVWVTFSILGRFQCANTFELFTRLFIKFATFQPYELRLFDGCNSFWFFDSICCYRIFLVIISHARVLPSVQVLIAIMCAGAGLPAIMHESEFYLFGVTYLLTYHYGAKVTSFILKSLQELDSKYRYLCPRAITALVLLICSLSHRSHNLRLNCPTSRKAFGIQNELTVSALYPYSFDQMNFGIMAERICITPVFAAWDVLVLISMFIVASGAPRILQYLGNGALGTFVFGSFYRYQLAWRGVQIYQVPLIPSLEACGVFVTKYIPTSDSWFFSTSQWMSLMIWLFPMILFAATFGRLYQEALLLLFKMPSYLFSCCANLVKGQPTDHSA